MNIIQINHSAALVWQRASQWAKQVDRKVAVQTLIKYKGPILACLALIAVAYITHDQLRKHSISYRELPNRTAYIAKEIGKVLLFNRFTAYLFIFLGYVVGMDAVKRVVRATMPLQPTPVTAGQVQVAVPPQAQETMPQIRVHTTIQDASSKITYEELMQSEHKVRGFTKFTQDQYVNQWMQEFCEKNNAHYMGMLTDDNKDLLEFQLTSDLSASLVFIINHHQHYSVVVRKANANEPKIWRYNSKFQAQNLLEEAIIGKLQNTYKNSAVSYSQQTPQEDGWSCAFHVFHFVQGIFQKQSMEEMEKQPLKPEQLVALFNQYYQYLLAEQIKVPGGFALFYQMLPDNVDELVNYFQSICKNAPCTQEYYGRAEFINKQKQLEAILVKIHELSQKNPHFLKELMSKITLTEYQREFLYQTLMRLVWTKEALVDRFLEQYEKTHNQSLNPFRDGANNPPLPMPNSTTEVATFNPAESLNRISQLILDKETMKNNQRIQEALRQLKEISKKDLTPSQIAQASTLHLTLVQALRPLFAGPMIYKFSDKDQQLIEVPDDGNCGFHVWLVGLKSQEDHLSTSKIETISCPIEVALAELRKQAVMKERELIRQDEHFTFILDEAILNEQFQMMLNFFEESRNAEIAAMYAQDSYNIEVAFADSFKQVQEKLFKTFLSAQDAKSYFIEFKEILEAFESGRIERSQYIYQLRQLCEKHLSRDNMTAAVREKYWIGMETGKLWAQLPEHYALARRYQVPLCILVRPDKDGNWIQTRQKILNNVRIDKEVSGQYAYLFNKEATQQGHEWVIIEQKNGNHFNSVVQ